MWLMEELGGGEAALAGQEAVPRARRAREAEATKQASRRFDPDTVPPRGYRSPFRRSASPFDADLLVSCLCDAPRRVQERRGARRRRPARSSSVPSIYPTLSRVLLVSAPNMDRALAGLGARRPLHGPHVVAAPVSAGCHGLRAAGAGRGSRRRRR